VTRTRFSWRSGVAATAVLAVPLSFLAYTATGSASAAAPNVVPGQTTGLLPLNKVILESTVRVNLTHHSATLPLHRGAFNGAG